LIHLKLEIYEPRDSEMSRIEITANKLANVIPKLIPHHPLDPIYL
jgi:hypothetical protein